ncbi:lipoprotein [Streptomyces spiroverticillatus]|uniref:Lipoprotein n=1 Tax=Streptomyces finlayi TaxID=67296 RepID=A0A918WSI1_9ACTN|nr:hypothetical protein [Streptomyces finlayi]GGZ87423.1 lipoprotein [Streptomyces spiroverticillatus]GHC78646.1 lipoprotein [Streptomyces finlayi]
MRVVKAASVRRRAGLLAAALGVLVTGTACGIRTTQVPVDAGAAPSRVSCDVPARKNDAPAQGATVRVFLVCGAGLVSVQRVVGVPEQVLAADRMRAAQTLLDELQKEPSAAEEQAGFTTDVRGSLTVSGPRPGDSRQSLRLNRQPDDLPTHALAQIVCTYSGSAADDGGGSVELAGPSDDPPRAYQCTAALKARPEAVPTLGDVRGTPPEPSAGPTG